MAKVKVINKGVPTENSTGSNFNDTPSNTIFSFGRFFVTTNFDNKTTINYTNTLSSFSVPVTLDSLGINETQSEIMNFYTNNAVLNLDKTDLSTFIRFGSAYEFLRVSVQNVILAYPGSVFADSQKFIGGNTTFTGLLYNQVDNVSIFYVPISSTTNNFGLITNDGNQEIPDGNKLKNLNLSYEDYVIWSGLEPDKLFKVIGYTGNTDKHSLSIKRDYVRLEVQGNPFGELGTGTTGRQDFHIRPNNVVFEEFRALLEPYERNLVSKRDGVNGFEITLKEPTLLEDGKILYYDKEILWASSDGYNVDINTPSYQKFLNIILSIGSKYDQIKTDLIARFLTPASLKKYDFTDEKKTTKLLRLYGREFDQMKEFIDSLVYINKITYDKKNNIPDQLIKNMAKTFGWDYFTLLNEKELMESFLSVDDIERDLNENILPAEVDVELWRRILMNTSYFWKSKGTRQAIKAIFMLIGIPEPFINITEYVYTVDGRINPNTVELTPEDFPSDSLPYDNSGYPKAPLETNDFFFQINGDNDSGQAYLDVFRQAGFNLKQTPDNKKSWIQTGETTRQHYSTPQYYQEDSRLVINTKEVDVALDTSRGIEYDVYEYIQTDFAANSSGYTLPYSYVNISLPVAGQQNTFTLPASVNYKLGDFEVRYNGILLNAPSTGNSSTYTSGNTETAPPADYSVSNDSFTILNDNYAYNNSSRRDVIQVTLIDSGTTTSNAATQGSVVDSYTSGAAHGEGSDAFNGGVLLPNGKVIFVPLNSPNVGIYDPDTDTYTSGAAHGEGAFDVFSGGVLLPNGNIIFVPRRSANVGIYNPDTDTYTSGAAHGEGIDAFLGGVLDSNDNVIFVPLNSPNIGIYDPDTDTYTSGAVHGEGSNAFNGGVLLSNGNIIFTPYSSPNVGIYDPDTDTYTSGAAHGVTSSAFNGGVLLSNGKVIFTPYFSLNVGIYDPDTDTYTSGAAYGTGQYSYYGSVLLPNGNIIFVPYGSSNVGIYNPDTDTFNEGALIDEGVASQFFVGGVLLSNGKVIFVPKESLHVGIYNPDVPIIEQITINYIVTRIKADLNGTVIPLPSYPRGDVQLTINGIALTKGTSQFSADYIVDPANSIGGTNNLIIQNPDVITFLNANPDVQISYMEVQGSDDINLRSEVFRVDSFSGSKIYFNNSANKYVYKLNYKVNNASDVKFLIDGIALEPNLDYSINVMSPYEVFLPRGIRYGSVISAYYLVGGQGAFDPVINDVFGLGDISELSFLEFLELVQRKMINARNRKTVTDFKGGWYPAVLAIYEKYLRRANLDNEDPLLSNGYTFQNLYSFLGKYNAFFQKFVDQLLPATIIRRRGGLLIRNTLFTKQKHWYKRGVNVPDEDNIGYDLRGNSLVQYLGNAGSMFQIIQDALPPPPPPPPPVPPEMYVETKEGELGSIITGGKNIMNYIYVVEYGVEYRENSTQNNWTKISETTALTQNSFITTITGVDEGTTYDYRAFVRSNDFNYTGNTLSISIPVPVEDPSLSTRTASDIVAYSGSTGYKGRIVGTGLIDVVRYEDVQYYAMQYRKSTDGGSSWGSWSYSPASPASGPLTQNNTTQDISGLDLSVYDGTVVKYQYRGYMVVDDSPYYADNILEATMPTEPIIAHEVITDGDWVLIGEDGTFIAATRNRFSGGTPNQVLEYGLIYTQNQDYATENSLKINNPNVSWITTSTSITSPFAAGATGLTPNVRVYFRAFVKNHVDDDGDGYGQIESVIPQETNTNTLSISPETTEFTSIGGVKAINVSANDGNTWFVSEGAAWLSVVGNTGTGDGSFSLEATKNTGDFRDTTVAIESDALPVFTTVSQEAGSSTDGDEELLETV